MNKVGNVEKWRSREIEKGKLENSRNGEIEKIREMGNGEIEMGWEIGKIGKWGIRENRKVGENGKKVIRD